MNTEILREYGVYNFESFLDKTIFDFGFNIPLTSKEVMFIRYKADVQFKKNTGIESNIESVRDFFNNYKLYESNQNLFVYNNHNFFCEFKDFYKDKFSFKDEDEKCFGDYFELRHIFNEWVCSNKEIVPIDIFDRSVNEYTKGPVAIIRDFFDFIDSCGAEPSFHLFFDYNTLSFVLTCNITRMTYHIDWIMFDWQTYLNNMFRVPSSAIKVDYKSDVDVVFPSDSDTIQFLFPVLYFEPNLRNIIKIIFNGIEYKYKYEDRTISNPVEYYIYRFCKCFYIMTGITPFEWAKKEIAYLEWDYTDNTKEVDNYIAVLKTALPELEIQHRKIFVKNDFEEK